VVTAGSAKTLGVLAPTENCTTYSTSADPNLTRVFDLPCLFLEQGEGVITVAMIGKVKRMSRALSWSRRQFQHLGVVAL
jgi:hypothetical protein